MTGHRGLPHATDIVAALRAREVSAEEVARSCLDAITEVEPTLQAWAHLDEAQVLEQARERDRQQAADPASVGLLHGVPVGVKDIVDVAGMPTANGADLPVSGVATADAVAVARLRAEGAVIVGKTVTTEFALFRPGPTTNPHDPTRTPGGSSSGSAAAVGAGTIPLAIGTQTAGSIVRPASFCGVVGGKPTVGSVSRDGVTMCSSTLDTVGLLGSDVAGVAAGLAVMAADPESFTPAPVAGVRIGFCRTFEWGQVEPTTQEVVEAGVRRLSDHLDVIEVELPEMLRGIVQAQQVIMQVECADELAEVRAQHEALLSPKLLEVLDAGEAWRWAYGPAVDHAALGRALLDQLFADVDVLVAPAALGEAPGLETTGDPLLCRMWTLLGTPTIAVPGLTGPSGLPIGVQVVAAPGRDAIAIGAAELIADTFAGAVA
jgi:Asp-tRNA(Asn)/Glu-tRNA(Gln) amidotransferase A subunit family amidase